MFRTRLLDRNAYYWLAARDRIKVCWAWLLVLAFTAAWGFAAWRLRSLAFEWDVSFWSVFCILALFKVWVVSEVCSRLAEDRASGALELLLSSPLDVKDIARGLSMALWRQFGWSSLLMACWALFFLASALRVSHYQLSQGEIKLLFIGMLGLFATDLVALKWTGMWQSTVRRNLHSAMIATYTRVLLLPTVLFGAVQIAISIYVQVFAPWNLREVPWAWTALLWLGIGLGTDLAYGFTSRRQFPRKFREAATQRFATHSPRRTLVDLWLDAHALLRRRRAWSGVPRWKRRLLTASIILVAAGLLGFGAWRYTVASKVEAHLDSIRAARQPVTLADLSQLVPDVPDPQNAATFLHRAAGVMFLPSRWPESKNPHLLTTVELRSFRWVGSLETPSPALLAAVTNVLTQNQLAFDFLQRAASLPSSKYSWDWSTRLPQLQLTPLRPAAPLLQLKAWWQLAQGDQEAALQTVFTLLGLAKALGQEPFAVVQDQRDRALNAAFGLLETILAQEAVPVPQLEALARELDDAEMLTGIAYSRVLLVDRCLTIAALHGEVRSVPGGSGWENAFFGLLQIGSWFVGITDVYLLRYLRTVEPWIRQATSDQRSDLSNAALDPSLPKQAKASNRQAWTQDDYFIHLRNLQRTVSAQIRATQCAVALEQYRAVHPGSLPESLLDLSPRFLPDLPLDPFGSTLLKYRQLNSGYVIYSVGPDGQDNLGTVQKKGTSKEYDLGFTNTSRP